ncbi:PDZ domain-containing protein [Flavobacterium sp. NST-5]|uniref:PDZ domain-containing protein n=1 Tax=Flavobacterium ichthyis TaxID=2698827 RepID=A0ABW9Z4X2_9FLAO|nr:S41 family peptidase [Flavobacterium ichthyis]NBL63887.1 PDZ domain-containing protein [Flavobacterium ichthyis]
MKNKSKIYLPIIIFTALAVGVILGGMLNFPTQGVSFSRTNSKNKLNKLIDFIDREYVDDINTDSIVDLTVTGILDKLDPHSVYIAKNEFDHVSQSMKGDFVGIGVNFYVYKDSVAVIKAIENGPAAKAGIQSGDRILYAGKHKLFGKKISNDTLFAKLRGEAGSHVELTVYRKSINKKLKLKLTRDIIPIKSVDVAIMLNSKTGYIKVNRFAETTYKEFKTGLTSLQKKGAKTMVVDLRDNGGGYLDQAIDMADEFLKDDLLIVFTKNKKGNIDKTYATSGGIFESGKIYILINENSASASEIFAGAIQDHDRGLVVGRRSFGKGLVQREMPLGDGSAVRLTVARYYTPTGRSIQKSYDKGSEEYFKDFEKRFESGELYDSDSIKVADTLKFKTPSGRIVYGGGGIVPDIFVPLEVEHGDEAIAYLMQSGLVGYFAFEELEKNRDEFKGLSFEAFQKKINETDLYFNNFQKYLVKNAVLLNLSHAKPLVKRYLAAEFARQLFDDKRYYEIILQEDAMVKKVLEQK